MHGNGVEMWGKRKNKKRVTKQTETDRQAGEGVQPGRDKNRSTKSQTDRQADTVAKGDRGYKTVKGSIA